MCGKGGKWAISVAGGVCGMSCRRGPNFAQDWNFLPARATHTIFCHASARSSITAKVLHRSMQQPDYSTKTIFHERNDLVLFILIVEHGGYNMNTRRCNLVQWISGVFKKYYWGGGWAIKKYRLDLVKFGH